MDADATLPATASAGGGDAPPAQIGRYRPVRVLGSGGMRVVVVWAAELELRRPR
jgi:hypothetical protein